MNSEKSVILQFFIDSNENPTLHTFNTCFILLRIDNNTPMYTFGDIAWTRGRIFTEFSYFFMKFEKSVIFTIFHRLNENTTLHTFNTCFILLRIDKNTPMYTFGDIAWTRGRIFTEFSYFLWILKSLSFLQFFIDLNENTTLHTFNTCFILLRIDNTTPMYTFGDIAWTRGRIFTEFSYFLWILKSLSFLQFFIDSNENMTLHTFY